MGTESESRKIFQRNRSFSQQRGPSQDGRQRSLSRNRYDDPKGKYNQDPRSCYDKYRSVRRQDNQTQRDWSWSQNLSRPRPSPRCIGCRCDRCYENVKTCREINEILLKKVDVKIVETKPEAAAFNLCEEAKYIEEAK